MKKYDESVFRKGVEYQFFTSKYKFDYINNNTLYVKNLINDNMGSIHFEEALEGFNNPESTFKVLNWGVNTPKHNVRAKILRCGAV